MKNLAKILLLAGVLSLPFSSFKKENPVSPKTIQDVEVVISYDGTAQSMPFVEHYVNLYLDNLEDGQTYKRTGLSAHPDDFNSKTRTATFSGVKPGGYELWGWWDWDDDGGRSSYEPEIEKIKFTLEGDKPIKINTRLLDRTSSSSSGWIEGEISYGGNKSGNHKLYVRVTDANYQKILENDVTLSGIDLSIRKSISYLLLNIPPGGPYRALSYWDVNDNGTYDGDPTGDYFGVFLISPGLPTVKIDIPLTRNP